MDFFNRFVWIFTSPSKVFSDVKEGKASWWQPWVWMSAIYIVVGYYARPIQIAVTELNLGNLTPEQLDKRLELMEGWMYWVQLASTPLVMLVAALAVSGISYILVSILSERANFKKYFTISLYTSIVASLASVVATLVIRMKGVETIRTAADAKFSIGLAFLAPEEGMLVRAILSSVDFFSVWSYVLIAMGLMHVFDMSRKNAIYCLIPIWMIQVLFLLIAEATGSMG
jgi:hypothetical protein